MIRLLAHAELRAFLISAACASLAESALAVVLGVHVYALTHDPLALAMLGLVEAVPAIALVLVGGHVADRVSRWRLTVAARMAMRMLDGDEDFGDDGRDKAEAAALQQELLAQV